MKRNMLAPLVAICVILLGLSVGSFFFTPDRAFSENENRYLQTTPELTADNVLSGKFMTEVENYTSDQILLRDFWTGARSALQRLEGRQDISGTYLGADGRYFAKVTDDTFNWDSYQKNLYAAIGNTLSLMKSSLGLHRVRLVDVRVDGHFGAKLALELGDFRALPLQNARQKKTLSGYRQSG